jgi:DNA-binding NarL/FixJ family response regulator
LRRFPPNLRRLITLPARHPQKPHGISGEAFQGELERTLGGQRPDVALVDVSLPGEMNGVAIAEQIIACCPDTAVVLPPQAQ